MCKGTKLNNARQKTKHIYLCPRRFPCFLRPPLSQERGRMNNYFFIPKIRDLHYSLIPPRSSPSIFSVTFACRANWFLILVQRLATACDDFTTTPGIRYSPTATLPFFSANGPLPGLIVAPLESFGRYRLSRLRSLRSLHQRLWIFAAFLLWQATKSSVAALAKMAFLNSLRWRF